MDHEESDLKRVNLNLTKKDWCGYKGECLQHLNITNGLCYHCCWKIPIDIPAMIKERVKNGNSNK